MEMNDMEMPGNMMDGESHMMPNGPARSTAKLTTWMTWWTKLRCRLKNLSRKSRHQ